jgi:hypothetical protein
MNGGRCRTGYIVGKVVLESGSDCPAGNRFSEICGKKLNRRLTPRWVEPKLKISEHQDGEWSSVNSACFSVVCSLTILLTRKIDQSKGFGY